MSNSPVQGSHGSLSQDDSQARTVGSDIPLETLVDHLLAAKRALSSISIVLKANDVVTSARSALEESVILRSRAGFLKKGMSQQARILVKVRGAVEHVYDESHRDFQNVLQSLDEADLRLQKTMDVLRNTMAEAAFRPADEEPRSLLDFVDEAGVETARTGLKDSIDQSQEARAEFLESIQSFDSDIQSIKSAMKSQSHFTHEASESPLPPLLQTLEENATEMAGLLQSLIRHFDICVSAVKNTEGGFAAVKQAASNNQLPEGVTVSGVIQESSDHSGALEPLSEEERREMLAILSNDAAEVEDVVQELHHRLSSMEEQYDQVQEHISAVKASYSSITAAFSILEAIGARLPAYIASSNDFVAHWAESKLLIHEQMDDLESMRVFYEGYMSCYDGLIIEVSRRRAAEEKMKAILKKAMDQVHKLHDADTRQRAVFRRDVGDFLPSDIWPGLVVDAPRYEISFLGEEEDEEAEIFSTPELERTVVEEATRREKERGMS